MISIKLSEYRLRWTSWNFTIQRFTPRIVNSDLARLDYFVNFIRVTAPRASLRKAYAARLNAEVDLAEDFRQMLSVRLRFGEYDAREDIGERPALRYGAAKRRFHPISLFEGRGRVGLLGTCGPVCA